MRYVYFTKSLRDLDVPGLIAFCQEVGLAGVDLAVRPGYAIAPDNAAHKLPEAAKAFRDAGLFIGLVTAPVNLIDPRAPATRALFAACAQAKIPAMKIGYFAYQPPFDACLKQARDHLTGFAKLAAETRVRACYHTHSGGNLGNNAAALRLLLQDLDPHHVGAFVDTGHLFLNGGPIQMELDIIRPWLSLLAIKDIAWEKHAHGWQARVVPAGKGMVRWPEVGRAVKEVRFNGTVSLHGEYEAKDMAERKRLARQELALLRKILP